MYLKRNRRGIVSVKVKLVFFIVMLAIIPVIVINVCASVKVNEVADELITGNVTNILNNQSENMNIYFEEIIASIKEIASSENVKSYTSESNGSDFVFSEESEEYIGITKNFDALAAFDPTLRKIMLINNSGMIIASTDSSDIQKRMSNYKGLFNLAQTNNGISSFFMSGDDTPSFIVTKSIYSADNEFQGIVYQLYGTDHLQKSLNTIKLNKYTAVAVMDNTGNLLEYPYKVFQSYSNSDTYKNAGEVLRELINSEASNIKNKNTEFGAMSKKRVIFNSYISTPGWNIVAISDKFGLEQELERKISSVRNVSVILIILSLVGTCIFVYIFTKPIDEILRVFPKKQRGDVNAQFNIKSNDEFKQIALAFDSTFNDLFESDQRYKTFVDITNNIIFEVSFKKNTVFVSKNFNKKFSFRPKDDSTKESFLYKIRLHKDDRDRYLNDLDRLLGPSNFMQGEYRVKSIYGDFIWIMIKATKFYNRDDVPTKIIGVIMDIDKEKKSEMHLLQRANYDALTKLYNRETFIKSLDAQIELSNTKKSLDAMMFIDLDDFKFFNDEYGHACGDEVLKFVADTLKEICFERGFAGRFGGDEFVACLTNLTLYGDSGKIAQEIIDILGKGFISESTGAKLAIHCSIGISFLRENGKNTEEVIAAADEAMYNIKKHGKSAYAYAKSKSGEISASGELAPNTSKIDDVIDDVIS